MGDNNQANRGQQPLNVHPNASPAPGSQKVTKNAEGGGAGQQQSDNAPKPADQNK